MKLNRFSIISSILTGFVIGILTLALIEFNYDLIKAKKIYFEILVLVLSIVSPQVLIIIKNVQKINVFQLGVYGWISNLVCIIVIVIYAFVIKNGNFPNPLYLLFIIGIIFIMSLITSYLIKKVSGRQLDVTEILDENLD